MTTLVNSRYKELKDLISILNLEVDELQDISNVKFTPQHTFFVAKNGNDTTGSGSINSPFTSITGALNYVSSNIADSGANVLILVAPGSYLENITITRPRTHIVGMVKAQSNVARIDGNITINPSSVVGGLYNSIFTLEGLLIAPSSGDAITISGVNECNVFINDVYCYTDGPGVQRAIVANQTSSTKTRISLTNVLCNTPLASSNCLSFSNSQVTCDRVTCYTANTQVLVLASSTVTASNCWFETDYSSAVVFVDNSSIFSVGYSFIYNKNTAGDGISIATGGQTIAAHNTFQITGSSGFAVRGIIGSIFIHALNCFVPGSNNKMSSAMGAGAIAMTSSFTSV